MPFFEAVRLALQTIRVQKLKSFFTLLGVMIGVMFLIAVISIVQGMSDYVQNDFAGRLFGVNTFQLARRQNFGPPPSEELSREYNRRPLLYPYEVEVVRAALPEGSRGAISNQNFLYATSQYGRPRQVQAVATESEYFAIKKYDLSTGRAFTPQEVSAGAKVIVIGAEVADHFFPGLDPEGRELRIRGTPYTVVGVITKQGSVFGFSLDRLAIAPWTTPLFRVIRPKGDIGQFTVQAPSKEAVGEGIEDAREVLRGLRRLPPGRPDNFALSTDDSALAFFDSIKQKLVVFGAALPFIGLLVGALVIMNIMLVAVAERTREIGIRKALGAKRRDILAQFLVEAATLSILGAAIGIGLGIGAAKLVAAFSPLPASVAPWSIVAALFLGAGVGIVAGMYPASRAASLDPITALRQE